MKVVSSAGSLIGCTTIAGGLRITQKIPCSVACSLLFWEVIFAPIDGAFFIPYQSGPADLFDADFILDENAYFKTGSKAESKHYRDERLVATIHEKQGIQNPFVIWSEPLPMVLVSTRDHSLGRP